MRRNFIDRFYEESIKDQFWNRNKKIGIGLIVLFLAVIMINTTGCTKGEQEEAPVQAIETPQEPITVGNDGVKAGIAGENISSAPGETVEVISQQDKQGRMVAMSLEDAGRSDPFLPDAENANSGSKLPYDLIVPSETITVDPDASKVITTKVSGIMYDKLNPSAILNIEGSDYLVRSGDIFNKYKVLSIDKSNVTVQLGANIYKAGVGQIFSSNGVNFNTVSNLESKFGGTKNNVNRN